MRISILLLIGILLCSTASGQVEVDGLKYLIDSSGYDTSGFYDLKISDGKMTFKTRSPGIKIDKPPTTEYTHADALAARARRIAAGKAVIPGRPDIKQTTATQARAAMGTKRCTNCQRSRRRFLFRWLR